MPLECKIEQLHGPSALKIVPDRAHNKPRSVVLNHIAEGATSYLLSRVRVSTLGPPESLIQGGRRGKQARQQLLLQWRGLA